MRYAVGLDGNWYLVFKTSEEAWEAYYTYPSYGVASFGNYDNAIRLTNWQQQEEDEDYKDFQYFEDDDPYDWDDEVDCDVPPMTDVAMDELYERIYK